jgi:hypothetical protein
MPDFRGRMVARLRQILAGQDDTGCLQVDQAEVIVADLLDSSGLAQLLADERRHLIELRADGWTIQHPLACRAAAGWLFGCPVNRAAEVDLAEPPAVLGVFEVDVDDVGGRLLIGAGIAGSPERGGLDRLALAIWEDRGEQSGGGS